MNYLVPDYLSPYVLTGTLAIVGGLLFGIHKALVQAGWTAQKRRRAVSMVGVGLGLWYLAALVTSWKGLYRAEFVGRPTIPFGVLIPIVAGLAFFWSSRTLRDVVEALPQRLIVGVQLYRAEGLIFLILYASGYLPGAFAWPAGVGDVLVGLFAPFVAVAYSRGSRKAGTWVRVWNLLGIADLIVALTTGFLTSPSPLQMLAFDRPNQLISAFPLAMIPVFAVPLAILLHLASLKKLRQGRSLPAPVYQSA